jgi:hypothetical protein
VLKIAVALAIAAVAVALRWWTRRYDALGRPRGFPTVSVAVLAVLAVGAAVPPYLRHREDNRLTTVATSLVGAKAVVHCQTFGQEFFQVGNELGYVRWGRDGIPEHQTTIMRGPCADLRKYLSSDKQHPTAAEIVAVHVLTHESMHMRGITSEAVAECAAVQRDSSTAELLGANPTAAMALERTYWRIDYPRMSTTYQSAECAPGGALDEHLPNPPWSPQS